MTHFSTNLTNDPTILSKPTRKSTSASPRSTSYSRTGKRLFDVALVIASAPFTLPIILILVIAVVITGQAPFYVQKRIGLNGKAFRMWKLRTMLPNAKTRLETYLAGNPAARAEWNAKQKLINDPRVTPLGNWLRKTSLDELPQLFNVLNGTMSIVGPRPMMLDQKEQYYGKAYYSLRPGMTGLWQVSDRNGCDFTGRVRFDDLYGRLVSLRTDVTVIAKTVAVMVRGTGV